MTRFALCGLSLLTNIFFACQRAPESEDSSPAGAVESGASALLSPEGSAPVPALEDAELDALTRTLAGLRVVGRDHPERLDAAIADSGLSAEQIDAALFRIAANPAASALYVQLSGE